MKKLPLALAVSLIVHGLVIAAIRHGPLAFPASAPFIAKLQVSQEVLALPSAVTSKAPAARAVSNIGEATSRPTSASLPPSSEAHAPSGIAITAAEEKEAASAVSLSRSGEIVYLLLSEDQIRGRIIQRWQHDDAAYSLRSQSELAAESGKVQTVAVSHGTVSAYGLLPAKYATDAGEAVLFDWPTLTAKVNDSGATLPLPVDAQDALSIYYHLGQALLHSRSLDVALAAADGIEQRRFEALGVEEMTIAGGQRRLMHLLSRGATRLEVWISLDAQHLPLMIRRQDAQGSLEQIALSVTY